jgi:glycosyltransferase involved in cell wall biosynthesis
MKVKLDQNTANGVGGVTRVYDGLLNYLPKHGVELVDNLDEADVLHAHIALYEKIPADKPLVVSSHGMLWTDMQWGGSAKTINSMCVEAYRQADVVTTPSDFVAHALARNMCMKAKVVRHGIDSTQWQVGPNEGYVLWNKARIDAANDPKDVDMLAFLAPQTLFVATYANKAPNIKLVGQLPHAEMKPLVQSAGVYLDTAKESGGPCFGVLEALSCGVPVLSWNFGGTPEAIIHGETGYLAEPGNYKDLFNGLQYCQQHRERLSKNALDVVYQNYQWDTVITGYIDAYQYALEQHRYTPQVSVIIPCYNLGRYLPACLDSVLNQSFTDWEALIVDDCSSDNSLDVALSYAEKDARIKVLHNSVNQHVSYSRNAGIKASHGAYILPLDADDRLETNALQVMVDALADRSINIVSGKLKLFNESDLNNGWVGEWPNNADFNLQITGYNRLSYASMYRRRVWEQTGGYRTRIRNGVEDADFWTRALSYGHRAQVIDDVTLLYTLRENSLGKQNDKGTEAWLPWFGWANNPKIMPFGASVDVVSAYDRPQVSVVIPVGPGHEPYIQTCIDSLIAQVNADWEAIVVNDTGHWWIDTPNIPFITVINSDQNVGVAAARNKGILSAKSDKIIFLDVDDLAQPGLVELFLHAQAQVGGWVYADWYVLENGQPVVHESKDWDVNQFRQKMLSPVTGIYDKQQLIEAGLFDTQAPGWEDWDMQLALVSHGYCGTRLSVPLITYNMQSGFRREENFSKAHKLVQWIQNKYGDQKMACSKCGGKATLKMKPQDVPANDKENLVLMQYTGPKTQKWHQNSKTKRGVSYTIIGQKPFYVFESDLSFLLSFKHFKRIDVPKPVESPFVSSVLVSQETVLEPLVENLPIDPKIRGYLKDYTTTKELKTALEHGQLIKGIGPARLKELQRVLNAV